MFYTALMQKTGPKKFVYLLIALLIVAALAVGCTFILDELLHMDNYREQIMSELQRSLQRKVSYEKGTFALSPGPSLSFTKLAVLEKDGTTNLLTADHLTFKIALLPLLQKKILLKEVVLDKPRLALSRDRSGSFNIGDLLETKEKGKAALQIRGIRIKRGSASFVDFGIGPERVELLVEDIDLSLSNLTRGKKCQFKISGNVAESGKTGSISLTGSAKLATHDKTLADTTVTAAVVTKNIDASRYWPYYSRFVPFKKVLGEVDMDCDFKGKLTEFTSKGTMKVSGLRFDYPQVFHSVLTPRDLHFKYDLQLDPNNVRVKSIDLNVDGAHIKGNCAVQDIRSSDIRITAQATSSSIRLEDFYAYIPYGIIVSDTADFIEQRIKGGTFTLEEGTLDGTISQIVHMEKGRNYEVLAIRAKVEKGLLTYGSEVPAFHDIKGELELRGKDFLLHRMTGQFGSSPFSLEGKITDYPLDKPSSYPFAMNMTPQQPEIAWLLGKERGENLNFSGESQLHLSGEGETTGYKLSGEWSLTPASYSYHDVVAKPAGRTNAITFRGSVNKDEAKLLALHYNLAPMSLEVSGSYSFADKNNNLAIDVKANQFQVNEVAQLLPAVASYNPSGKAQAHFSGKSTTGDISDLSWSGNVTLAGLSIKVQKTFSPLSNINGTINFNGSSLETTQLVARLGSSTIYGKGTMVGFKTPVVNMTFSTPSLNMADLGLHAPQREVIITQVHGNVTVSEKDVQIKSLSGQIGNSSANVKGTVLDIDDPKVEVVVTSPYLDLNDILLLLGLEKSGKAGSTGKPITLKASIHAEAGQAFEVGFENLRTALLLENDIAYLQPAEFSAFGGRVTAKGRIDAGTKGSPPRYQFSYGLHKVSLDKFIQAFGIEKQEITGTLSMQGDLTGRGHTAADLKKSALGSIKFKCEKGSLQRFGVLSKIFSILNVSQLLKFKLPDMISGGMPYNQITASVAVKDGVVTCSDFFISSDAINISAVGKVDLVRETIDATIGVQPLQTVDKVVNRIPVVGWILTGDKNSFLSTYFEAKGKVDDPVVRAIPVKAMAKGVLDIFMRVFELPAKLITDTGEVLIGK